MNQTKKRQRDLRGVVFAAALGLSGVTCAQQEAQIAAAETLQPYFPLVEKLFAEAGLRARVNAYPPERSMQLLLQGEVDAEFLRTKFAVAQIASEVTFIGPLACTEVAAFARKDGKVRITKAADLDNYKLAALVGHRLAAAMAKEHRVDAELLANPDAPYRMLDAGRVDVVLDSVSLGLRKIKALGLEGRLGMNGPFLSVDPTYLIVRRHREDWGPRLEKAFNTLRRSGAWQRMVGDMNQAHGLPRGTALSCFASK